MLEIIILIGIIYLIFIGEKIINENRLFKNEQKISLKNISSENALLKKYLKLKNIYSYNNYINSLLKCRKIYENIENKISFNPEYDKETDYIKNMDELVFSNMIKKLSILIIYINHYYNIIEYIRELEIKTLLGDINYKDGKKQYKQYINKIGLPFDIKKDIKKYSTILESEIYKHKFLIEHKGFDLDRIKKYGLNIKEQTFIKFIDLDISHQYLGRD